VGKKPGIRLISLSDYIDSLQVRNKLGKGAPFKMVEGFFETFLVDTARCINENFNAGAILEVKHIRRFMDVGPKNRSKIIFLARALQKLADLGYIEFMGKGSPKRFRKNSSIPIEELQRRVLKNSD
jgi:hypothetical protein